MTKQQALRAAANRIENNPNLYAWHQMATCNCGILSQIITKTKNDSKLDLMPLIDFPLYDKSDLYSKEEEGWSSTGAWSRLINHPKANCEITGLSVKSIFYQLRKTGFTVTDLAEIEFLSNKTIRGKVESKLQRQIMYNYSLDVIAYFRTWADMLDEQETKTHSEPGLLANLAKMKADVITNSEETNEELQTVNN